MSGLTCDDFKNMFNFNGAMAGLVGEQQRNLQCWTTDPFSEYDWQFDISMDKRYDEKMGLTCALEAILWENGYNRFCNQNYGVATCCTGNGIPDKRDTIDYDYNTVVDEIQNITERTDPAADAASVVCASGWIENGFLREKFFVDGITCDEITNFFLSEQPLALPNDQDRNLLCYAATGTEYNNPGYPLQIDISTNDTPDGKQSMTCEMKQLMKSYGVDLKFCNPITQTCCLY
ncbi:hypothetical protein LTR15_003552 [Elasticomyces elasticus]|nr:hypothetical protein LTR15_003552 [Elasticomyces elasticus]